MVENAEYSSSNNGENYKKFDLYRCIVTLMVAIILAISLALAITLKSFYYVATAFPMVVITSLVLKLSRIRCRKKGDVETSSGELGTRTLESRTLITTVQ